MSQMNQTRANPLTLLHPDWPAPSHVKAMQTTRSGGCSSAPYASLNLGDHVGDAAERVAANRELVGQYLPNPPIWLQQAHGITVVDPATAVVGTAADAAVTRQAGAVCVVMTADCLPVLFCDRAGTVVGAAHAGWRGLCDGVLEATMQRMAVPASELLAWLGPAIGAQAFEVGAEVRAAFVAQDAEAAQAFQRHDSDPPSNQQKYLADIYALARLRLQKFGVSASAIFGGNHCTVSQAEAFFSYRRDKVCGRMGSLIWLDPV